VDSKGYLQARAVEADRLLNGPVFADAMAAAREQFIEEWEEEEAPDLREVCWAKVVGLKEVQRQLRRIIAKGEYASRQPDE
jgi:hypothetical protein